MIMHWQKEEEEYLRMLEDTCLNLSKEYHEVYFKSTALQTRLRIPAIVIGSFTGIASFGTSNFPERFQHNIAIIVGVVNVAIAILNTLETFFKVGENINATLVASTQLRKLANDINKELCLERETRETSGINYLRDSYTRYQQIISSAPLLQTFKTYQVDKSRLTSIKKKRGILQHVVSYITTSGSSQNVSLRASLEENKLHQKLQEIHKYTLNANNHDIKTDSLPIPHTIDIEEHDFVN
jgi:hypothetical protein